MDCLVFLDNFVKIYGLKGLNDYETEITVGQYKDISIFLKCINSEMKEIKKLFNNSQLNLSRKNYEVDTVNLAFSLLKNLLQQCHVPFEMRHTSKCNYLRLIPVNKHLMEYIDQKMNNNNQGNFMVYEKREPSDVILRDILGECKPRYLVGSEFLPRDIVSCASLCTLVKLGDSIVGMERCEKFVGLGDCVVLTDDCILKEVVIPMGFDICHGFRFKVYDENYLECDDDYIKKVYVVIGNEILTDNLELLDKYEDSIPLVACGYQPLRLVFVLDKKHIGIIRNLKLYYSYYGGCVNKKMRDLMRINRYDIMDGVSYDGMMVTSERKYITGRKHVVYLDSSQEKYSYVFPRHSDIIYDISVRLVDSFGVDRGQCMYVELNCGGNETCYSLDQFRKDNPIPIGLTQYSEFILTVRTPMKGYFIEVRYKTRNLSKRKKEKLKDGFYVGGCNGSYLLIADGMVRGYNEVMVKSHEYLHYNEVKCT